MRGAGVALGANPDDAENVRAEAYRVIDHLAGSLLDEGKVEEMKASVRVGQLNK